MPPTGLAVAVPLLPPKQVGVAVTVAVGLGLTVTVISASVVTQPVDTLVMVIPVIVTVPSNNTPSVKLGVVKPDALLLAPYKNEPALEFNVIDTLKFWSEVKATLKLPPAQIAVADGVAVATGGVVLLATVAVAEAEQPAKSVIVTV